MSPRNHIYCKKKYNSNMMIILDNVIQILKSKDQTEISNVIYLFLLDRLTE